MKNYLLEKIIKNSKSYPQKKIIFEKNKNITWEELIKKSKNLSQEIAKVNQDYIPIIISRNIDSIISILATIFANKSFCPISEKFPNKKIKKLFVKLQARKFINCSKERFSIKGFKEIKSKKKRELKIKKIPNFEKIFYILFTSGSTGEPKGVKLSYKNILNTLAWSKTYLKWKKKDFIGLATELSFDISMFDLFSSLFYNVSLFIFSNPSNPLITYNEINKYSISSIFSVPSFFSNFSNYGILKKKFNNLEQIISGGDYFPPKEILKWKTLQNKTKIFNVWGPTETSIVNSMHKLSSKDYSKLKKGENIPIGKSHKLMPIKLINEQNEIITQPFKTGEICMLGDCISKGYLGDIENNKNYIVLNKHKAFRTRDNGYFDKDKNLYFSSRIDHMIKISGYRIDALEIQKIINSIDKINNSAVFAQINKNLTKNLCLAIETKKKISIEKVRKKLKINLPLYSVPKKIFLLKKFPLNSNGKEDKKKPLLKSKEAIEIANLIVKIFPEYYNCFGASLLQKRDIVKKLFFKKNFEFEKIYTIKSGKELVGVATVINSKRLKIAKTLGFLKIVNYLGSKKVNKRKINNLKKSFCKINSSKPYLTRFGVNLKFRGIKNLSSKLIRYVIKNEKFKLIAHVNKNNKRAIKFYLKNKFKIIDKRKKFYLIEFKGIKKVYEN